MARLLFEEQSIRTRRGRLVTAGTVYVVYTDAAGTVPADISATSGGSAIAGSAVAVADIAGLGPAAFRFYGPDGVDTLYLRCLSDASLGVQEIEADTDERLDALEAAAGGAAHPDLATHDTLGLATDAELATHAAAADPHGGYVLESAHTLVAHDALGLATDAELTTHEGASDPHGDRAYADATTQGLDPKASVLVKTTGNLTLAGEQTIDGVLTSTSRVLVANQTAAAENGVYVSAAGAWSRATDADASGEVTTGLYTYVEEGTTQASSGWVLTTPAPITLDVTPLTFSQFSQAGQVFGGAGLVKTGNTLDVSAGPGLTVTADTVGITPGGVSGTELAAGAVTDAKVDPAAAIAESKLALAFPTHAESHAARHAAAGADPLTGYVLESAHTADLADELGPLSIASLFGWYPADRLSLANGAAVSTWTDASGNGLNATQATGTAQPTYQTNIVNGLPAVSFDGNTDGMATASFSAQVASTIFAVVKLSTTSASRDITDGSSGARHTLGIRGAKFVAAQGGTASAGPNADTTTWHVVIGRFTGTAASQVIVDGTAAAQSNIGSQSLTQLSLGIQGASAAEFLGGQLAEVGIYNRVLSAAECNQLTWALATKYALTTPLATLAAAGFRVEDLPAARATTAQFTVKQSLPVFSAMEYGTRRTSATLQAAVTDVASVNQGGGIIELPRSTGAWAMTAELVVPQNSSYPLIIRSDGVGSGAQLKWTTDLGAGTFGIRPSAAGPEYLTLEWLRLSGPSASVALGAFPASMDGVQLSSRMQIRDCHIAGFRAGVKVVADHNRLERCTVGSNGYGLYWQDTTAQGDHTIYECDLSGNKVASVAIGDNADMLGTTFIHGHLGFSPYAIYMEPGRNPTTACMGGVVFDNTSIESVGNGAIVSPDYTGNSLKIAFRGVGQLNRDSNFEIAAHDTVAVFVLRSVERWTVDPMWFSEDGDNFDEAVIMAAEQIKDTLWVGGNLFIQATTPALNPTGLPLFKATTATGNRWEDGADHGTIAHCVSGAAITAGQVTAWGSDDQHLPYATAYGTNPNAQVSGVALTDATSGASRQELALIAFEGRQVPVTASSGIAAAAQVMVNPAARNEVVTYDGGFGVHLGRLSTGSATSAGTVTVDLHKSRTSLHTKPTVTGSRSGNAALADLLTDLAALGIITDSTTA